MIEKDIWQQRDVVDGPEDKFEKSCSCDDTSSENDIHEHQVEMFLMILSMNRKLFQRHRWKYHQHIQF